MPVATSRDQTIDTPEPRRRRAAEDTPEPVAPVAHPMDFPTTFKNATNNPWRELNSVKPSKIFIPDALEPFCQKILESATCDGDFEWSEGLLKSWIMIQRQGDEAKFMGMYSKAKKARFSVICVSGPQKA
mmetsp:Transcript_22683/g.42721  ORF Transcript_22683/g.42721 Transcript_22683/m.42721 type:complete len:130 (+) Transcript_22683:185-574(+)